MTDEFTLDVAFALDDPAPDAHHQVMAFGYAKKIAGGPWQRAGERPDREEVSTFSSTG